MPIPTSIAALSQTAGSNDPVGGDSPTIVDDCLRAHGSFIAQLRDGEGYSAEVDVASAATCDIGAAASLLVRITGTTTITSFGTNYAGPRFIRFSGALTLTHAATLVLPGAANITTAAGDTCIATPISGGWVVSQYQQASDLPSSVPAGSVIHVAMSTAPVGYLKANGAAVSRTTYARLFAAIGTTFGNGDGLTTFNLPDLRGEFVRGWDDSRGVDSARGFGSQQADAIESHNHPIVSTGAPGSGGTTGMPVITNGAPAGAITTYITAAGSTETRPRNVALLACIKY